MKGIFNIAGENRRVVLQGVQYADDSSADRLWKADEPRRSEIVFIGRNPTVSDNRRPQSVPRMSTEQSQPLQVIWGYRQRLREHVGMVARRNTRCGGTCGWHPCHSRCA